MRVLVVHNRYSSATPSGENVQVDSEVRWLRDAGVEVTTFEATNDTALGGDVSRKLRTARDAPWSRPAARSFHEKVTADRPDLVHVHNLFPLITASVPAAALDAGLPVVWTAHNRRLVCIEGSNFRDGAPCHDCQPGRRLAGIRHGCYRNSVPTSALITTATGKFRQMARRRLMALAPSKHIRDWLVEAAGLPSERVQVKYNGVHTPELAPPMPPSASQTFVVAGRLAEHKGIDLLLKAWEQCGEIGARLRIVGDGPMAADVEAAAERIPSIEWVTAGSASLVAETMAQARAVIVPSLCDEAFGRTAAEGLALGRPVITTGFGGLREIVDDSTGWITGAEPEQLAAAIVTAADSDAEVDRRGQAARDRHRQLFSPEATTRALLSIYEQAQARSSAG